MSKLLRLALALLAGITVILAVSAVPASAAYSDCPSGVSCVFTGQGGTGSRLNLPASTYNDGNCHNLTFHPVGGYHSAKGGYGSGLQLLIYSDNNCNTFLDSLANGETWSGAFSGVFSVAVT